MVFPTEFVCFFTYLSNDHEQKGKKNTTYFVSSKVGYCQRYCKVIVSKEIAVYVIFSPTKLEETFSLT